MNKKNIIALTLVITLILGVMAVTAFGQRSRDKGDPWLGVYVDDVDRKYAKNHDLPDNYGVIITDIIRKSPAYNSELKEDDVIIAFNGEQVYDGDDLTGFIEESDLEKEVVLTVIRDGQEMKINVLLEKRPRNYNYDKAKRSSVRTFFDSDVQVDKDIIIRTGPGIDCYRFDSDDRPFIGIKMQNISRQLGEFFGVKRGRGALITEVYKDSPAEKTGMKAGDVIVSLNDEHIFDIDDVTDLMMDFNPGDTVAVKVIREKSEKIFKVEIAESGDFDLEIDHDIYFHGLHSLPSLPEVYADDFDDSFNDARGLYFLEKDEIRKDMKELGEELNEMRDELEFDFQTNSKRNLRKVY